jgi:two-component system, OmpR family, sensor histidine kinase BaeS
VTGRHLLSPLGIRLAVAFVAVAVAAIAVVAGLTLASATGEVSELVTQTHRADAHAAADVAAQAYERAGGWADADLSSAAALAARGQAELTVVDRDGRLLAAPASEAAEMMARMHGLEILDVARDEPVIREVTVDGDVVGAVQLRFPTSHLPTPEREIRHALIRNAWTGVALAVVSAIAVAVVVARLVSRPIGALTSAATAMAEGRRDVRVGLDDAPGELGTLSVAFDRMAAAVEEEDRLRRQLVADVAHEVRTPLTILQGTTEALVDGIADPDAETLASLHDEVLRLTRLVSDLETLAAADAAGLHLEPEPTDLAIEVRAVLDNAGATAAAADLDLEVVLGPAPVVADPRRIRQLTTTLIANALAYTPAGGTITVRTRIWGDDAVIEISDTGPGIDPDDLPRIFDRFYRGRRTAGTGGSGVGLAVASELVAAHGGTIHATNRDDAGASFIVRLPAGP